MYFGFRVIFLLQLSSSICYDLQFLVTYQSANVVMYFTARTFYFRVITVVHWLPVTDWLVYTLRDMSVAVLTTLMCTSRCLLCANG
jgi:hypothetical protein